MADLTMFYLRNCPFCKKAFKYIEQIKAENIELTDVKINVIEEEEHPEVANLFDYYYVPAFYLNGNKLHEGGIFKNEVEVILRKALNSL